MQIPACVDVRQWVADSCCRMASNRALMCCYTVGAEVVVALTVHHFHQVLNVGSLHSNTSTNRVPLIVIDGLTPRAVHLQLVWLHHLLQPHQLLFVG